MKAKSKLTAYVFSAALVAIPMQSYACVTEAELAAASADLDAKYADFIEASWKVIDYPGSFTASLVEREYFKRTNGCVAHLYAGSGSSDISDLHKCLEEAEKDRDEAHAGNLQALQDDIDLREDLYNMADLFFINMQGQPICAPE